MTFDSKNFYETLSNFSEDEVEEYAKVLHECSMREFETRIMRLNSARSISHLMRYAVEFFDDYKLSRLHNRYGRETLRAEREAVEQRKWYENEDRYDGKLKKFAK